MRNDLISHFYRIYLAQKLKKLLLGLATSEDFVLVAVAPSPFPFAVPAHVRCLQAPQLQGQWQGLN